MFLSRTFLSLCACAMLIAPSAGLAQMVEATPVPLPPPPDFSSMNFLVGKWSCSTMSSRRPGPYTSTSTYSMDPSGWWLNQTTVTDAMSWFPHATTVYDKTTYDATSKRWVDVTYGDLGAYGLTTSPGWVGNAMVWHDANFAPGPDIVAQTDTTNTKVSDTKVTSASSFTEAGGRKVTVTTTCNKS